MTTSRRAVDDQIARLDVLVGRLQAAMASYHDRPVDWADVEVLGQLEKRLVETVRALGAAEAQAELRRAARSVSVTVRQLAAAQP